MKKIKNIDTTILFAEYIKTGNKELFNTIIKYLEKKLFNKINYYINDEDLTYDILQNTWIRADKIKNEFNPSIAKFDTWLFSKIIWGYILQTYKKAKKNKEIKVTLSEGEEQDEDFLDMQQADDLTPDEMLEQKERNRIILKILKKINESYQDVFILHNIAGFSLDDLSVILNAPYATIRTWHRRAKNNIINLAQAYKIL